jgi:hypothetical protein
MTEMQIARVTTPSPMKRGPIQCLSSWANLFSAVSSAVGIRFEAL